MRVWAVIGLAVALAQDPREAIDRIRAAWSRQDAAAVVAGATRIVIQLPGEAATAPLGTDQAARAIERLFKDATEVALVLDEIRPLGQETVYAEMRRRFRVRGSDAVVEQRVFAAFRLDEGRWRLAELRIGVAGR
ncbi:MAG TPA: hypothetical protein VFU01_17035 [Gemmatimonadaceae bacterium]|nr:hypothetical protein [Gemmatimonadaceae bacterium]